VHVAVAPVTPVQVALGPVHHVPPVTMVQPTAGGPSHAVKVTAPLGLGLDSGAPPGPVTVALHVAHELNARSLGRQTTVVSVSRVELANALGMDGRTTDDSEKSGIKERTMLRLGPLLFFTPRRHPQPLLREGSQAKRYHSWRKQSKLVLFSNTLFCNYMQTMLFSADEGQNHADEGRIHVNFSK
jgi:hypothetical protein